ncbi:TSUP family transporter [Botryobacter ruber]|uniref:TSUP family transporter n=1 Tax=Botryobacter ruber TaxID=2171629 RepID=UPI000E0AE648|nr:TSUP family transporter [Botryobacter ruber]
MSNQLASAAPQETAKPKDFNPLFPVFLKLEQLRVLVVGGGPIGMEKMSALLANSPATNIDLVAPDILPEIFALTETYPGLTLHQRKFEEADLEGKDIVLIATSLKELNREIRDLAKAHKILTNVADTPAICDFYLGSIVQKGSLKLAISTNGKSPTVAKRIREVLNEAFPDELESVLTKLTDIRKKLSGDFAAKVVKLNEITEILVKPDAPVEQPPVKRRKTSLKYILLQVFAAIALMVTGHLLFSYIPFSVIGGFAMDTLAQVDEEILIYILAGFVAQMIDGALGMAYGVSATTFLLSFGVSPVAASASVHTSEIFTSGVSGLMHLRFGNVNTKLFKTIVFPGVIGAIIGAFLIYSLEQYIHFIKPVVACYTLFLGVMIIRKVVGRKVKKRPVKRLGLLGSVGGFLDAIGGGGWGPIVSSTLIAKGRHPLYTIGSVNLAEFFVSVASSVTFITLIGLTHWMVIAGLIIGGMIAAPIAAFLARKLPVKTMMLIVGIVVISMSLRLIFMAIF